MTRKEARPKYTKDVNVNEKSTGQSRKGIKKYNNLIKGVMLGRMIEISKEMKMELKIKYVGMCGKIGVRNSLGNYGNSDDSDSEDFQAYNGFAGKLAVINIERTAAV